jgi:hypothetical protein
MKKKEELPMKLLDNPKIPTARRNPRRPHHSHKPLNVAAEMGLKPGRPYCTRRRHHQLSAAPANLDPKKQRTKPSKEGTKPSIDEDQDPPHLHGLKATETRKLAAVAAGGRRDPIAGCDSRAKCFLG